MRTGRTVATLVGVLPLLFTSIASESRAAVIQYGIVSNGVESTYGGGLGTRTTQWLAGNGEGIGDPSAPTALTPLPPLTATFEGSDTFTIDLSAPPGMHFEVVDPGLGDFVTFFVDIYAGSTVTDGSLGTLDSLVFHDPVGTAPGADWSRFAFDSGDRFRMRVQGAAGAPFEFTGLTFTFTTPADMAVTFTDEPLGYGIGFGVDGEDAGGPFPDPGQWVFLVRDTGPAPAIPEPGTVALLGIGLAAVARRRRR